MRGRLGLSAQALKWIAMVSMLIDHVGIYLGRCNVDWEIWKWFRIIGRIAFPLYCFLLVEGFFHTGDIKKYLIRIGAFALISEIPFDLFLCGTWFYPGYQNVGVTLFIGLLLLYLYNRFVGNVQPIYAIMALISMMCLGYLTGCDYGAEGVLLIFLFYFFRFRPVPMLLSTGIVMVLMGGLEPFGVLAFLPILFYNGNKGWTPEGTTAGLVWKYSFYVFYPLHLLVLAVLSFLR